MLLKLNPRRLLLLGGGCFIITVDFCVCLTLFKDACFYPSDILDITSQSWKQFISLGCVLPAKKIKSSPAAFPNLSLQTDKQSVQSWQPSSRSFTEVCTRPCLETRGGSELTPNSQFAVMCRGERQRDEQRRGGQAKLLRFKAILLAGLDTRSSSVAVCFLFVCYLFVCYSKTLFCVFVFPKCTHSCFLTKLTDESLTNLTCGFGGGRLVLGAGEISFLTQSGSVCCAHYCHAQPSGSYLSLLLSCDVLSHPVPSTQTLQHAQLHPLVLPVFPFIIVALFLARTMAANTAPAQVRLGPSPLSHLQLASPPFYVHMRKCLPF